MTSLTKAQLAKVQAALNAKGFLGKNGQPLAVDGIWGPNTSFAVITYKTSVGLAPRDYVGPITYAKLTGDAEALVGSLPKPGAHPEWYGVLLDMMGKNEDRHNAELRAWLKSDGDTVGDPSEFPWCGDAVQTSILLALPTETMPDNPYAAVNWVKWGKLVEPQLGAILSFWRGSPTNWQGHVGLYAGESESNFYVLGGNQGDSVTIAPIAKNRLRVGGSRWPLTGEDPKGLKVSMTGGVVSTNEA